LSPGSFLLPAGGWFRAPAFVLVVMVVVVVVVVGVIVVTVVIVIVAVAVAVAVAVSVVVIVITVVIVIVVVAVVTHGDSVSWRASSTAALNCTSIVNRVVQTVTHLSISRSLPPPTGLHRVPHKMKSAQGRPADRQTDRQTRAALGLI
jgi:hypothetical protein